MAKTANIWSDSPAFRFVLIMGLVNLFGDMTYEGGGSINGQFLGNLGASAATISIIAGLGEFFGYSLRSVAGYVADKSGRYWLVTLVGYVINLFAVPAMALAGSWQIAALLIFAERTGRAIRKPSVEAMLSYTTGSLGKGWVYAVNTALDETGATVGPLVMALVLFFKGTYQTAYAMLLIAVIFALISLLAARIAFPVPSKLEQGQTATAKGFTAAYWLYMAAGALFASGLLNFELISYHFSATNIVSGYLIPVLLAFSTGAGVIANLVLGRLFDRFGLPVVLVAVVLSALFAPIVFAGGLIAVWAAMPLWGIGYATQDTLLKAIVAGVLPEGRRNLAFGLFYTGYGGGWLVGSIAMGELYEHSRLGLIVFAFAVQLLSLPLFVLAQRQSRASARAVR
jgi:hypothetical protein